MEIIKGNDLIKYLQLSDLDLDLVDTRNWRVHFVIVEVDSTGKSTKNKLFAATTENNRINWVDNGVAVLHASAIDTAGFNWSIANYYMDVIIPSDSPEGITKTILTGTVTCVEKV